MATDDSELAAAATVEEPGDQEQTAAQLELDWFLEHELSSHSDLLNKLAEVERIMRVHLSIQAQNDLFYLKRMISTLKILFREGDVLARSKSAIIQLTVAGAGTRVGEQSELLDCIKDLYKLAHRDRRLLMVLTDEIEDAVLTECDCEHQQQMLLLDQDLVPEPPVVVDQDDVADASELPDLAPEPAAHWHARQISKQCTHERLCVDVETKSDPVYVEEFKRMTIGYQRSNDDAVIPVRSESEPSASAGLENPYPEDI